jgi:hypothetical protein
MAEFGEPQPMLERAHERYALFLRLDCAAGDLTDAGVEILIAVAQVARSLTGEDGKKILAYARALAAW